MRSPMPAWLPILCAWAATILAAPRAQASFVLRSQPIADVRLDDPNLPPPFPVALAFGTSIPLAFALKQIVPPGVMVFVARGVNQRSLVSWRGGRTWNQVLAAAIARLGLHAEVTPVFVRLERQPEPAK